MDEKEQKLLEFLLADFKSIKNEIARRSNLQKAAIAALLAFYAWEFNSFTTNGSSVEILFFSWGAALLAGTYVYREGHEISKLGWKIKNKISKPVGEIIGFNENSIIPSEAHALESCSDSTSKFISVFFAFVLYFIVPLFFTFKHICDAYGT